MAGLRGFEINLYESALRKSGGVLQLVAPLTQFAAGVKWDVLAQGWYGTATFAVTAPPDVLMWLYDLALEYHLEVVSPELTPGYEGFVSRLVLTLGSIKKSKTLDDLWNEVRFNFGDHQSLVASDPDSQTAWGIKRIVQSSGRSARSAVQDIADRYLDEHKDPHGDTTSSLGGESEGGARLEVTCQGYWQTLAWANYKGRNGSMDTGRQIQRVLKQFELGARVNHGFLSTDYAAVRLTGKTRDQEMRNTATGQQRLLKLMNIGNSSGLRLMGGVGPGRKFFTFARPQTIDYFYDPYEVEYRDSGGAVLPKWCIEPGRFVYLQTPFPAQQPTGDPVRSPNYCQFINRVQYDLDADRIALENPDGKNILRVLARAL